MATEIYVGSDPLEAAISYAQLGWTVMPIAKDGKQPLSRHGVHDASTDVAVIQDWWARWPAANVGIACGHDGLIVIDVDDLSLASSIKRRGFAFPGTLAARTGRVEGGLHLYYATGDATLRNTAGRLPGLPFDTPGIDLRAAGGYVVAPPSKHASGIAYRWDTRLSSIAERAPEWLKAAPRPGVQKSNPSIGFATSKYGRSALITESEAVRSAQVGSRNDRLNRAAFSMGQLVAAEHLDLELAIGALLGAAVASGLPEVEALKTIRSGVKAGVRVPREVVSW